MLEVHPNPSEAAVDPLQCSSFNQFHEMMEKMSLVARAVGRTISNK